MKKHSWSSLAFVIARKELQGHHFRHRLSFPKLLIHRKSSEHLSIEDTGEDSISVNNVATFHKSDDPELRKKKRL